MRVLAFVLLCAGCSSAAGFVGDDAGTADARGDEPMRVAHHPAPPPTKDAGHTEADVDAAEAADDASPDVVMDARVDAGSDAAIDASVDAGDAAEADIEAGGECSPAGTVSCSGPQAVSCVGGKWMAVGGACAFNCSMGACSGECVPGTLQCVGMQPQTCSANYAWVDTGAPCDCISGQCL